MGDTGVSAGSQLVKDVISSQNGGSQEGSDNGQELSEEIDKLQQVSFENLVFFRLLYCVLVDLCIFNQFGSRNVVWDIGNKFRCVKILLEKEIVFIISFILSPPLEMLLTN